MTAEAHFLVGSTATGKSAVAQHIAEQDPAFEILSADSMLVYRGMDIGTAKPTAEERRRVTYHGIDLQTPDRPFSVWEFRAYALPLFNRAAARGRKIMVVGGSGLYIKCLTDGLDPGPSSAPGRREHWAALLEAQGIEALQNELGRLSPEALDRLDDRRNVRRLIRALEAAEGGVTPRRTWSPGPASAPLCGLAFADDVLRERIASRVEAMYDAGLLEEVRRLKEACAEWSATAMQAIGYREALRCLSGEISQEEAIDKTTARTRKFAKRQRTWFRHQADVRWADLEPGEGVAAVAGRVLAHWRQFGPTAVKAEAV